jgi:hypothetical protein
MENIEHRREDASVIPLEFIKGCPACEHSDPQLERELQAFAQLFFDIYLESHAMKKSPDPNPGV